MSGRIKKSFLGGLVVLALPAFLVINGCGSSDSSSATDSLSVLGTISAPTTSASLSALTADGSSSLQAAVANEKVKLCLSDGSEIGTGTTGTDGKYSIDVKKSVVNPDDAESVTKKAILISESGYMSFAEVTVTKETATVTVDADVNSAIASANLLKKLGGTPGFDCAKWNLDAIAPGFDLGCFFKMEQAKLQFATAGDGTLGSSAGVQRDMMAGLFAKKDFGTFGDPFKALDGFAANNVPADVLAKGQANAQLVSGKPASAYSGAANDLKTSGLMRDDSASKFAAGTGVGAFTASNSKSDVTVTDGSLCDLIKKDPKYLEQFTRMQLAYGSLGDFQTAIKDPSCVTKMNDTLGKFKKTDGSFDFAGTAGDPKAIGGIFKSAGGDCKNLSVDGMKGLMDALPANADKCGPDADTLSFCVVEICKSDPTGCDKKKAVGYCCSQKKGYEPAPGADIGAAMVAACPAGVDCAQCIDPTAASCIQVQNTAGVQGAFCGDNVCQTTESATVVAGKTFCSADCGGGGPGGAPPPLLTTGSSCQESRNCASGLCTGATPPATPGTCS